MIQTGKTILIVDDEPLTREGIRKTLEAWSIGVIRYSAAAMGRRHSNCSIHAQFIC